VKFNGLINFIINMCVVWSQCNVTFWECW